MLHKVANNLLCEMNLQAGYLKDKDNIEELHHDIIFS